jgi:hypothetical protein
VLPEVLQRDQRAVGRQPVRRAVGVGHAHGNVRIKVRRGGGTERDLGTGQNPIAVLSAALHQNPGGIAVGIGEPLDQFPDDGTQADQRNRVERLLGGRLDAAHPGLHR